jgi:hypothetical protein
LHKASILIPLASLVFKNRQHNSLQKNHLIPKECTLTEPSTSMSITPPVVPARAQSILNHPGREVNLVCLLFIQRHKRLRAPRSLL